jgi:hypothetical protein
VFGFLAAIPSRSLAAQQAAPGPGTLRIRSISDTVVILTDGTRWVPGIHGLQYLGALPTSGGAPYFVLAGYPCDECDNGPQLYVLRPPDSLDAAAWVGMTQGPVYLTGEQQRYGLANVFLGQCLSPRRYQLVEFWHRDTLPALVDSVFMVDTDSLRAQVHARPRSRADVAAVQHSLRVGSCQRLQPYRPE